MMKPLYHVNSSKLGAGSIIEPGNWGRIIRLCGPGHTRFAPEAALEDIRRRENPDLPSRLDAAFYFDDVGEARFYAQINAGIAVLYEVELVEPDSTSHVADWRAVSPIGDLSLDWARSYWAGTFLPPHESGHNCREILTLSALRIITSIPY